MSLSSLKKKLDSALDGFQKAFIKERGEAKVTVSGTQKAVAVANVETALQNMNKGIADIKEIPDEAFLAALQDTVDVLSDSLKFSSTHVQDSLKPIINNLIMMMDVASGVYNDNNSEEENDSGSDSEPGETTPTPSHSVGLGRRF